jgi:hypothetical protein
MVQGPRVVGGTGYQLNRSNLVTPSFDKGTHEIADRLALLISDGAPPTLRPSDKPRFF